MQRILIIDDAQFMRFTYRRILAKTEAEIVGEAENGPDGVALYVQHRPDSVILDLTLPGMSGQDVLREIRRIDPAARVIVVSAMGQDAFVRECLEEGARSFISKPFKEHTLLLALGLEKKLE